MTQYCGQRSRALSWTSHSSVIFVSAFCGFAVTAASRCLCARSIPAMLLQLCELGAVMQTADVRWIGEQKFVATSPSGHTITLDSDSQSNKAPTPMELLLMALGACSATDVVLILEKKRQKLQALEGIC